MGNQTPAKSLGCKFGTLKEPQNYILYVNCVWSLVYSIRIYLSLHFPATVIKIRRFFLTCFLWVIKMYWRNWNGFQRKNMKNLQSGWRRWKVWKVKVNRIQFYNRRLSNFSEWRVLMYVSRPPFEVWRVFQQILRVVCYALLIASSDLIPLELIVFLVNILSHFVLIFTSVTGNISSLKK